MSGSAENTGILRRATGSVPSVFSKPEKPDDMFRSSPNTKVIHVVRHGKARDGMEINDIDRTLTEKGIINSIAVARQLYLKCGTPGLVVTSTAARAFHTAHIFARYLEYPAEKVLAVDSFYRGGYRTARDILENLPDGVNSVMFVGHIPEMIYLANAYTGERKINELPTSGAVTVRFDTSRWDNLDEADTASMVNFPKNAGI